MDKKRVVKTTKKVTKASTKKTQSTSGKIERVSSGVQNFDLLVNGGFEKNSTNLIVGGSGSGKTLFGLQFLVNGMKDNEKCLFISFEERKAAFFSNFKDLGIDLAKYESSGNFFFLEYTPQKVRTMLEEGGGAIEALVLTQNISRIVIDSITSFSLLFEKDLERKEAALALFSLLKGWNCTTVLVADEESMSGNESLKMVDQEVDSIILMHFSRTTKERKRSIEILKMRGTNHSLGVHEFKISNQGLVVNKTRK